MNTPPAASSDTPLTPEQQAALDRGEPVVISRASDEPVIPIRDRTLDVIINAQSTQPSHSGPDPLSRSIGDQSKSDALLALSKTNTRKLIILSVAVLLILLALGKMK